MTMIIMMQWLWPMYYSIVHVFSTISKSRTLSMPIERRTHH